MPKSRPRQRNTAPAKAPVPPEPDIHERSLDLLTKVRQGQIAGKSLPATARQSLVNLLLADGVTNAEMASILGVTDRTIERDRNVLRDRNALSRDPALVERFAGRVLTDADQSIQRIRRVARERDVPAQVKIEAEATCFKITVELVDRLQKLGHLPTAAQTQNLHHHVAAFEPLPLEAANAELGRLAQLAGTTSDPLLLEKLAAAQQVIDRSLTASVIDAVKSSHPQLNAPSDGDDPDLIWGNPEEQAG